MKKYGMIFLAILLILVFVAGCAKETMDNTDSDMMDKAEVEEMTETPHDVEMQEAAMDDMMDISYVDLTPEDAKMLIESTPDLIIIDVSPKYDEGHLPGAINYYLGDGSLDKAIPDLDKTKPYLVYCHVDSASISGAMKLVEAGFDPVYRLEGNYAAWDNAGYTIEK